ncbi:hypothetical protein Psesu_3074 [Pseudoxanthomonas suwonensis 11-1]|uniref:Lipoprotein n=1 Tax=Pseudoxanthomonas suwonensis (strain 11-1) TaxID=743721 RepID=E6WXN1_PSEUU|nr:hypothetical protein [Pseudoxanthomonas suwonensis]ADV28897.1 hypothetical protein Psesu_3074 [Pseudoxanthomonas suwonensis 11-1]
MKNVELKSAVLALSIMLAAAACGREQAEPAATPGPEPSASAPATAADEAPAGAATVSEQHRGMVRAGAAFYVAPEFCGMDYTDAERTRMREEQKQATVAMGQISASEFDAAFDAGIGEARQAFANASAAELKQTCDTLKAMRAATPQG